MSSIRVRSDRLQLDFRYRGVRCREQTALTDTKVNRAKLHALLKEIDSAIRLEKFVYSNLTWTAMTVWRENTDRSQLN